MVSGIPPKANPARRNIRVGIVRLPAEGRKGEPPEWPKYLDAPDATELKAWRDLWRLPQAIMWEKLIWTGTVARYCRLLCQAAQRQQGASIQSQVTVLEDRLGLNPKAMRVLLWEIASDEMAEQRAESAGARDRIRAAG